MWEGKELALSGNKLSQLSLCASCLSLANCSCRLFTHASVRAFDSFLSTEPHKLSFSLSESAK